MTEVEIIQHNEYLRENFPEMYVALNFHRSHKNEMLEFTPGMDYLRGIYLDQSDYMAIEKATQMGLTEYMSIRAIVSSARGRGVFYVLPTGNLVGRFVKNRIDRSIEFTPFYQHLLRTKASRFAESVSLKHIGLGSIAFVGSNSTAGFTEYPADDLMIDEVDECDQANLNMAVERLSASKHKRIIKVGNPTIMNFGIDYEYGQSDKKRWMLKCSHCNERQELDFFKNVVREVDHGVYVIQDKGWDRDCGRDVYVLCRKCGKPLDRHANGEWVPTAKSDISGYHMNKLFAKNVSVLELVERFEQGQDNETKLQRFYNGDLGMAFTSSGAKVTLDMLEDAIGAFTYKERSKEPCIIGIDVGSKMHTVVGEVQPNGQVHIIFDGMLNDKDDVDELYRRYNIKFGVIDAGPEKRLARAIVTAHRGMFACYYGADVKSEKVDPKTHYVHVDRTASLDAVREAILIKKLLFPRGSDKQKPVRPDGMSEFFYEMMTSTRVYNERRERYEWVEGSAPDHYFHAVNYMLIALRIMVRAFRK